jgi:tetratricopeptide (TPR) repeat protein
MASLVPGYEYDIFVSYRQKDNKYDGWVTEFVDNLKRELEATFKEEISVYFDVNPHDGLLETYDVDASLKEKLKCLIFIPIISRTYCDPKSFAWEHEFISFVENASKDQFGLKVKLPNGNVANRILPVRIHDLDAADIKLCESVMGGVLRGVEFIYKEPGVNKPLTSEDDEKKNLNRTKYRIQINKIANALKEIISGLMAGEVVSGKEKAEPQLPWEEVKKETGIIPEEKRRGSDKSKVILYIISAAAILVLLGIFVYPKIFQPNVLKKLGSSGEKISIAVMPFQNMTNDTTFNMLQYAFQTNLVSSLSNTGELIVKPKEDINYLLQTKGYSEYNAISLSFAGTLSQKIDADIFICGSLQKAGPAIRVDAQLIDTKTSEVLKSFKIERSSANGNIFEIVDSLSTRMKNFLLISKILKGRLDIKNNTAPVSPEALKYSLYGGIAELKGENQAAISWYLKALAIDSNYLDPMMGLSSIYANQGMQEENIKWVLRYYKKKDQMPLLDKLRACWAYASNFESPVERIKYLKQIQQIDGQPSYLLGITYSDINQYDKAIIEFEKLLEMLSKWGKEYLKDSWVYPTLGDAYHKTGQYKKEKKLYMEAEENTDDHESGFFSRIIRRQAVLSLTEKDSVAANKYITKYISIMKRNSSSESSIATDLAWIYNNAGLKDKEEEYTRKALSLEPGNPALLNNLACFLRDNNRNPDEFIEIIDKAIQLAPDKMNYYEYLDTKGWGLYKQGKYNEALDIYQKLLDEVPYKLYCYTSRFDEVKKAVAGHT